MFGESALPVLENRKMELVMRDLGEYLVCDYRYFASVKYLQTEGRKV